MKIQSYGFPKYEKKFRKIKITFRQARSIVSKLQFLFNTPPIELEAVSYFNGKKLGGRYLEGEDGRVSRILACPSTVTLDIIYHEFAHHLNRMTRGIAGHEEGFKYRLGQIYKSGITK